MSRIQFVHFWCALLNSATHHDKFPVSMELQKSDGVFLQKKVHYTPNIYIFFLPPVALRPNAGHGFLILEVSRSHTATHQSVGLIWMSDQPVADTSTWQHATLTTDRHPCPLAGFEPTILAGELPYNYALDRMATGMGTSNIYRRLINIRSHNPLCLITFKI